MKKLLLLATLLTLLSVTVHAQGELYKQYSSRKGLTVAQVTGFKLNDSIRIDLVIIEADNDAAWSRLKEEFKINDNNGTTSWLGNPAKPAQRIRWNGGPATRVIASAARKTIAFYILENEQQYSALVDYQMDRMQNKR